MAYPLPPFSLSLFTITSRDVSSSLPRIPLLSLSLLLLPTHFTSLPLTPRPSLFEKFHTLKAGNTFVNSVMFQMSLGGGDTFPSGEPFAHLSARQTDLIYSYKYSYFVYLFTYQLFTFKNNRMFNMILNKLHYICKNTVVIKTFK